MSVSRDSMSFTAETEYDEVVVRMDYAEGVDHAVLETRLNGVTTSYIYQTAYYDNNPHLTTIDRRAESGEITVSYVTPWSGEPVASGDIPDWMQPYINLRDPLLRIRSTPLPTISTTARRRRSVYQWAVGNTQPRLFIYATVKSAVRAQCSIWWDFVKMNVAAAQHNAWLEDETVWPAIQRNTQIYIADFLDEIDTALWSTPGALMGTLSAIYKAGESLDVAPVRITLDPPADIPATLALGKSHAERIVFGLD